MRKLHVAFEDAFNEISLRFDIRYQRSTDETTRHLTRYSGHDQGDHQLHRVILVCGGRYWWVPHKSSQVGRPSSLNDSMIKCHEFPEPRYIIHREQAGTIAHAVLTVPRVQQR